MTDWRRVRDDDISRPAFLLPYVQDDEPLEPMLGVLVDKFEGANVSDLHGPYSVLYVRLDRRPVT